MGVQEEHRDKLAFMSPSWLHISEDRMGLPLTLVKCPVREADVLCHGAKHIPGLEVRETEGGSKDP